MTNQIIKKFLGIPIVFAILMGVITNIISRNATSFILNFGLSFSFIIQLFCNILILFVDSMGYFFMYKCILSKCDFFYRLRDITREEFENKENIFKKIKNNKLSLFKIIFVIVICQIVWFIVLYYYHKAKGGYMNNILLFDIVLFIPIFEEFIFRKIYFDYCKINNVKNAYELNIIIFSFLHIIPMPTHFVLAATLAYCYKKFDSLLLNIIIHFMYNFMGVCSLYILKSIG